MRKLSIEERLKRRCKRGHESKHKRVVGSNNLVVCSECQRLTARKTYKRRKTSTSTKQWKKYNKDRTMQVLYGLRLSDYENLFHAQNGRCAICNLPGTTEGFATALRVDHDHKTGIIRGLLCNHCNLALGHLRDDTNLLESAIKYLQGNIDV